MRDLQQSQTQVGYSVFETFEECYQYNENACFIAATREVADVFRRDGDVPAEECRIDAVCFADIMSDFGGSCGEYAMERDAFGQAGPAHPDVPDLAAAGLKWRELARKTAECCGGQQGILF